MLCFIISNLSNIKMDFLQILFDENKFKNTCFLCFKSNENNISIYENFVICKKHMNIKISLYSMCKYLFPEQEIIFHQACEKCTYSVLNMYMIIRQHNDNLEEYNIIINKLIKEVEEKSMWITNNVGKKDKIYLIEPTETELDKHIKTFVDCKKCDMTFESNMLLQKHVKIRHRNTNKAMICDVCGKKYKTPQSLMDHLNSHKEVQCIYCFKNLKMSYYKEHIRNHEIKERKARKRHYYNCDKCNYKSTNKSSLNAHVNKIHLCIRPFVCDICYKGFHKKSTLTEHIRIHDNRKELTCELCGESYVCNKTLKEHLRLHTGDKPYQCKICFERFTSSGRRLEHFKRKHGGKTECCLICDKKFSIRKEVNRHMKIVHKIMDATETLTQSDSQNCVFISKSMDQVL